jgi:dTMP kinase
MFITLEGIEGSGKTTQISALEPLAELLLYMADRAQHINELIRPALKEGKTVICDRYFDATLVYQGFARGLRIELIGQLHQLLFDNLKPDITLLLDLSPQVGLKRAWQQLNNGQRSGDESRFEAEAVAFHEKVRAGYLELARLEPDRFSVIDAAQTQDQVFAAISKVVSSLFKQR